MRDNSSWHVPTINDIPEEKLRHVLAKFPDIPHRDTPREGMIIGVRLASIAPGWSDSRVSAIVMLTYPDPLAASDTTDVSQWRYEYIAPDWRGKQSGEYPTSIFRSRIEEPHPPPDDKFYAALEKVRNE